MRRFRTITALVLAAGLVGCGASPSQAPSRAFRAAADHMSGPSHGSCHLSKPPVADEPVTPCTITGNASILVGAFSVTLSLSVDVTQPESGPPTGTVILNQSVQEPYGLRSETITSVECGIEGATITGTLYGGGTFLITVNRSGQIPVEYVTVVTPYYAVNGPVIEGNIDIDFPLAPAARRRDMP